MNRILWIAVLAVMLTGCDKQRDLYVDSSAMLYIEGDWMPSLGVKDMSGRATAILYKNGGIDCTEYFNTADNCVTPAVSTGRYGVVLFNGVMFSETDTNLSRIYFRHTDDIGMFEAVVAQAEPNRRLARAGDEYIASNNMEILTTAYEEVRVDGGKNARLKYRNGHGVPVAEGDYVTDELLMTPKSVSYYAEVKVHLANPGSIAVANGSVRGFVGSVYMSTGLPSHFRVTHQLRFNNVSLDANPPEGTTTGTMTSPVFVTFGPPVDLPEDDTEWGYEFELSIILNDGSIFEETFDVTSQILPVIELIKYNELDNTVVLPILIEIGKDVPVELPVITSSVGMQEWEDGEIIKIVVTG